MRPNPSLERTRYGMPREAVISFSAPRVLPQRAAPSVSLAYQLGILGLTWLAVDGSAMFSYAALGSRFAPRVRSPRAWKILNRLTGGFFIAAGGLLAIARR